MRAGFRIDAARRLAVLRHGGPALVAGLVVAVAASAGGAGLLVAVAAVVAWAACLATAALRERRVPPVTGAEGAAAVLYGVLLAVAGTVPHPLAAGAVAASLALVLRAVTDTVTVGLALEETSVRRGPVEHDMAWAVWTARLARVLAVLPARDPGYLYAEPTGRALVVSDDTALRLASVDDGDGRTVMNGAYGRRLVHVRAGGMEVLFHRSGLPGSGTLAVVPLRGDVRVIATAVLAELRPGDTAVSVLADPAIVDALTLALPVRVFRATDAGSLFGCVPGRVVRVRLPAREPSLRRDAVELLLRLSAVLVFPLVPALPVPPWLGVFAAGVATLGIARPAAVVLHVGSALLAESVFCRVSRLRGRGRGH